MANTRDFLTNADFREGILTNVDRPSDLWCILNRHTLRYQTFIEQLAAFRPRADRSLGGKNWRLKNLLLQRGIT